MFLTNALRPRERQLSDPSRRRREGTLSRELQNPQSRGEAPGHFTSVVSEHETSVRCMSYACTSGGHTVTPWYPPGPPRSRRKLHPVNPSGHIQTEGVPWNTDSVAFIRNVQKSRQKVFVSLRRRRTRL